MVIAQGNREIVTPMPMGTTMRMLEETIGEHTPAATSTSKPTGSSGIATVDCPCMNMAEAATKTGGSQMVRPTCGANLREVGGSDKTDMLGVSVFSFRDCLLARTSYKGPGDNLLYRCTVSCERSELDEYLAAGDSMENWDWSL